MNKKQRPTRLLIAYRFSELVPEMNGKDNIVAAAKNCGEMLQDIQIRSRFASHNQIMFAYDMVVPAPIGQFRAAVWNS
jgi:hypothetical protein